MDFSKFAIVKPRVSEMCFLRGRFVDVNVRENEKFWRLLRQSFVKSVTEQHGGKAKRIFKAETVSESWNCLWIYVFS